MPTEQWKPVPEYEESYEVSNLGRIRSIYYTPPRLNKINVSKEGTVGHVFLSKKGKLKRHAVKDLMKGLFSQEEIDAVNFLAAEKMNAQSPASAARSNKAAAQEPEEEEVWRDIEGFNGYQVSNLGRVRSVSCRTPFLLKQHERESGGFQVNLYVSVPVRGNRRTFKLTRCNVEHLVAQAFLPKQEEGAMLLHRDRQITNNKASNLVWVLQSQSLSPADMQAAAQPAAQGTGQAAAQPATQGTGQTAAQPATQGTGQTAAQPATQGTGQTAAQPATQGTGQTAAQPATQGAGQPAAQGTKQASAQPAAREAGQAAAQGTQASAQSTAQRAGQTAAQPAAQGTGQAAVQPAARGTGQAAAQPATQGAKQATAQPATRGTGQAAAQSAAQGVGQTATQADPALRLKSREEVRNMLRPRMSALVERHVSCQTLRGGTLYVFANASSAAKALGCQMIDIMAACEGLMPQLGGYRWQWARTNIYKVWAAHAKPITSLPLLARLD